MKTVKEFFNKLESENKNIEVDYNDMDIIIFNNSYMVGRIMLYDYDNDCEDTYKNIELPFEYLTTIIMKFRSVSFGSISPAKETILNFASDNEVMKELMDMKII